MAAINWDYATIARLRELWTEKHSTAEIARRMGVTKNAICGKAHRLGLEPRPSPIIRDPNAPRPVRPPRITGPTLPRLSSLTVPEVPATPEPTSEPSRLAERISTVLGVPRSPVAAPRPSRAFRAPVVTLPKVASELVANPYGTVFKARVGKCTWTDCEQAPWLFCEAPTSGGSWCESHRLRVFHRISLQPVEKLAGLKEAAD